MRAYLHGTKGHAVRNVDSERGVVQIMGRGEGGGPDQKNIYSVKLLGQDLQGKEWKKIDTLHQKFVPTALLPPDLFQISNGAIQYSSLVRLRL